MCAHIREAMPDPAVRDWVREAMRSPGSTQSRRAAAAAWWWYIKHHVFLREDSDAIAALLNEQDQLELLIAPSVLVRMRRPEEDCDGFTMLACAGLVMLGIPCAIVTIAAEPENPRRWSHVYAIALLDDGTLAFDCSHGDYPGWEVPAERQFRRQAWSMAGEPVGAIAGAAGGGLHGYVAARRARGLGQGPTGLDLVQYIPGLTSPATSAGTSWSQVLQALALKGGDIAQQLVAPLRPGEFVQTGQGVRSREVAGAVPDPWASASGSTSVVASPAFPTWLLVAGGVGLAAMLAMSRRSS